MKFFGTWIGELGGKVGYGTLVGLIVLDLRNV